MLDCLQSAGHPAGNVRIMLPTATGGKKFSHNNNNKASTTTGSASPIMVGVFVYFFLKLEHYYTSF
jgi:hypothetical protein